jgi:hypothetical protein
MQMDAKTTWWLTLALVAVQGLNSVAWGTLGISPHVIAGIAQATGYLTTLLLFAVHGTIPGVSSVQMPKAVVAALALGLAVLALGWAGPAHAQRFSDVPPMVVENLLSGVIFPAMLASLAAGLVIGFLLARCAWKWLPVVLVTAAVGVLGWAGPADAQVRTPAKPTGNPIVDIGNAIAGGKPQAGAQANPLDELAAKIKKLSLDDFKYAAALAHATGNNVTAPCWDVWVKLLTAQQQPLNGPDGQPLLEPDPHLATDVERLSEMIHQLLPNSELSVACAPMASAAQKDAGTLIGAVLNGGALGLFKLPFAIP